MKTTTQPLPQTWDELAKGVATMLSITSAPGTWQRGTWDGHTSIVFGKADNSPATLEGVIAVLGEDALGKAISSDRRIWVVVARIEDQIDFDARIAPKLGEICTPKHRFG